MATADWYYYRSGRTSCKRASTWLDARSVEVAERIPASRKLGRKDAEALAAAAARIFVAKGRSRKEVPGGDPGAADLMVGRTGNLRAPTIRVGDTLIVGYHEEGLAQALG